MARQPAAGITLYVSPAGKDAFSGLLAEPNARKTDGPLATPAGAQAALRKLRKAGKLTGPATVLLREGTYFLRRPLAFEPEDSGAADAPVTFCAYEGEKPIVSGGRQIRGFEEVTLGGQTLWAAKVAGTESGRWDIRELFVNGRRAYRPRLPSKGFYRIAKHMSPPGGAYNVGEDRFGFARSDIRRWKNLQDVEVVVLHYWCESRLKIKSVDTSRRTVTFSSKSRRRFLTRAGHPTNYYVENVFEAIQPGQWYLNKRTGVLYYMPLPNEQLADVQIVAPRLGTIVAVQGRPAEGKPVKHLHFEGLSFQHAAVPFEKTTSSRQAAEEVGGAVVLESARNCSITRCEITNVGTYAVELRAGCRAISIVGNHLHDVGAGGVTLSGAATRGDKAGLTCNNVITDNYIHHGGRMSHCGVGILCRHSGGNTISHNHIHDLYYTGISIGWVWGYRESVAQNNLVEANHIHDIGRGWLNDMGGIYTLGDLTGGVLRRNLIHDVTADCYGGWGLYTDEGSTNLLLEDNVTYNTNTGGFHQHYGRENIVRNNIFGPCAISHIQRTRQEEHLSFKMLGNIFYIKGGEFTSGRWESPGYLFDRNVYFRADGKKLRFGKWTFRQWQERGQDPNSIVADPRFVDPEHHDYRLRPDSPALALGFHPIDVSDVGPRPGVCRGYGLQQFIRQPSPRP